jgi:capsular polysaccharide biosynthesis protein
MEEEIDLRIYIVILLRYWYWIVGLAVGAALVAFIVSSFLAPTYRTSANVIILESRTTVSLEPRIQTEMQDLGGRSYQASLESLVKNSEVASLVLADVGEILKPTQQNVLSLLGKIDTELVGDVINISAQDEDPAVAAQLANSWARNYTQYVNRLLNTDGGPLLVEVQNQSTDVTQAYRLAQANWENFIDNNQISVLQRELNIKRDRLQALRQVEIEILERELAVQKSQAQALRNDDATEQNEGIFLFNQQNQALRNQVEQAYNELNQSERWLRDAEALRAQVLADGETSSTSATAGNALALISLRNRVLANTAQLPAQVQVSLAELGAEPVSTADVDSLITIIEERQAALQAEIDSLSQQILSDIPDIEIQARSEALQAEIATLDTAFLLQTGADRWYPRSEEVATLFNSLEEEIRALEVQLEVEQARQRELEEERDLMWDNYVTVQRKLAEVKLSAQITDSQVRVAGQAVEPINPISPRRTVNTAVAGAAGAVLAVFLVFLFEFWRSGALRDITQMTTSASNSQPEKH